MPTVLIADDDADHRELLTVVLRRSGHEVAVATDAASAMAVLRAGGIDAALIDVRMPGESGIDLCRRLRAERGTELLPVILLSADTDDHRIRDALRAGADDFLTKPFERAELCDRLANLLVRRPVVTQQSARAATAALLAARNAVRPVETAAKPPAARARRTA